VKSRNKSAAEIVIIIVIMFFVNNSFGENAAGFDFLNLPFSARSAGMGNVSLIGDRADILAVRGNPAMLSGIKKNAAGFDFSPIILDIYSGALSGATALQNDVVIAPSISYVSSGKIDAVDENADRLDVEISPFSVSVDCAAAYSFFEKLSAGARMKFVYEHIAKKSIYWDGAYCGGVALDLGIFSNYKIFRYSAGLRNVGIALDNYESIDVKFPASAFVAVGAIVSGEAKFGWFLECEKYFYDYLYFRTGLDIPAFRDILIIRAGTIFSPNDARNLFKTFSGSSLKAWEYSGEHLVLATVGATINAKIEKKLLSLDIACQFRKDGITPGLIFSGTAYF